MCHSDASAKTDISAGLDCMEFGQYSGGIWSQGGKHLTIAGYRQHKVSNVTFIEVYMPKHQLKHNSSYFAMVMRPTLFSGLLRVLEWQTIFTASC